MNTSNAWGFIGAGLLMEALRYFPEFTAARELWLLVMGGVLVVIGAAVLARAAWRRVEAGALALFESAAVRRARTRTEQIAAVGAHSRRMPI